MVTRRLIGYATTDANGVATMTYVGKGAGEVDIVAETGGEMLFADDGTANSSDWTVTSGEGSKTSTSKGIKLSNSSSTRYDIFIKQSEQSSAYYWNAPFTIEVDITEYSSNGSNVPRLQIYSNTTTDTVNTINAVGHWKIVYDGSTVTAFKDGVVFSTLTKDLSNARIGFTVMRDAYITYENLFIYKGSTQITSQSLPLLDCSAYDSGIYGSAVNQYYRTSTTYLTRTVETDGTGTTFANSHTSTTYYGFLLPPNVTATSIATSCVYPVQDYCIEVDVISYTGNCGLDIRGDNGNLISRRFNQLSENSSFHIRLEVKNSIGNFYIDGSETATYTSSATNLNNTFGVRLSVSSEQSVKVKDFKVYPI